MEKLRVNRRQSSCSSRGGRGELVAVRAMKGESREECVLAIDVGTGGTKAALVNQLGSVVASAFHPHPRPAPSSRGGPASVEQEVESWWWATTHAVQACWNKGSGGVVRALAVTGQMQNVIRLPKDGSQPIPTAILYSDARAAEEVAEVNGMAGGPEYISSITGTQQGASSLLAKLRWLDKHELSAAEQCQTLLFGGHDYVVWKLSGALATDSTTASTTGLLDLSFHYAEDLIHSVELGHWMEKLPPIKAANIPCGVVSSEAAEELGVVSLKGVPVLHCCGDAGACTLGAGAGSPGSLYAYIGTSGWVAGSFQDQVDIEAAKPSGVFRLGHPDESLVFKTGSIMTAGGNLAWSAANIGGPGGTSMEEIDRMVKLEGAGSGGLLYLPYLNGERCPFEDGSARGCFLGISTSTTSAHMFRAVMEGVAFAMRSSRDALNGGSAPSSGVTPLRLVGGGARSPVWPAIFSGVFGQTVEVLSDAQEVGVKGAALLAGQWLGWHSSLTPEGNWVQKQQSFEPSPEGVEFYNILYSVYSQAYGGVRNVCQELSALRNL